MTDYDLDILRLSRQGYCCAQIIMQMALDLQGVTNPGLIRAMTGLCHGEVGTSGPCGALSGAACLIAYYSGKGHETEMADERLPLMLSELSAWFDHYASSRFGGIGCGDITGGDVPNRQVCGGLVADCYGQAMTILTSHGFEPLGGPDD
ncbi:MAG: DVU_1555 family C-GCAxxG-C-C protein [Desulfopila sp.]